MALLNDIQADLLDESTSLATALRKAKVLASLLQSDELGKWVELELNGYKGEADLPEYRVTRGDSYGNLAGSFDARMRNVPLPTGHLDKRLREHFRQLKILESIRSLEDMVAGENDSLRVPWAPDIIASVQDKFYVDYALVSAWQPVSRGFIVGIVDTVRNRLLDFVLKLKEQTHAAEISDEEIKQVQPDTVLTIFNTYVSGDHAVVATGISVNQQVEQSVTAGNAASLLEFIRQLGAETDDIEALESAIEADPPLERKGVFGQRVSSWLGSTLTKIATGGWQIGIDTGSALITKALNRYYGLE